MKQVHITTGAILFLFATYIIWDSSQLSYYTPLGPGPGFFSLWLGVLLVCVSIILIIRAARYKNRSLPAGFIPNMQGAMRMGLIVAAVAGVAIFMEWLGFSLTMLIMYLCVMYGLGRRDFVVTPLIALAGSCGVYFIFTRYLSVPLPMGALLS